MQMMLASFGVLALMLAGCNSQTVKPADEAAAPAAAVEQPAAEGSDSVDMGITILPSEEAASTDK